MFLVYCRLPMSKVLTFFPLPLPSSLARRLRRSLNSESWQRARDPVHHSSSKLLIREIQTRGDELRELEAKDETAPLLIGLIQSNNTTAPSPRWDKRETAERCNVTGCVMGLFLLCAAGIMKCSKATCRNK